MIINPISSDSRKIGVMYTAPQMTIPKKFRELENAQQITLKTIKIHIPQRYHQALIISHLSKYYGLEVNILAAKLSTDVEKDGCSTIDN